MRAAVLVFSAVMLAAPAIGAQPRDASPADMSTARDFLNEGLALRDTKGDPEAALERFHKAYTLIATPITVFELAKTHMMLKHLVDASELFLSLGRMDVGFDESPRSAAARQESVRLAAEIAPRIPSIVIKVKLPPGASAKVTIDGTLVSPEAFGAARRVNPGKHQVVATAGDGPPLLVAVEVQERETKDVELAPTWVPPKVPEHGMSERPYYIKTSPNPLILVGVGMFAVGLTTGIVAGVLGAQTARDAIKECSGNFCPPHVIDSDFHARDRFAVASTIGYVVAIASVVVGGYAVARPRTEKVYITTGLRVTPSLDGISGTF